MFGVGHLGEVYMNLGPIGIVPIFFLLGIFSFTFIYILRIPKNALHQLRSNNTDVNVASTGLYVTGLVKIMFIGSTITDAYGGLIQLIVVQGLVIYFVARKSKITRRHMSI